MAEEQELEPRDEPGAVVVQPLLTGISRHDVASRVEHAEAVPVLQDAERYRWPLGAGDDGKGFVEHHRWSVAYGQAANPAERAASFP